MNVQAISGVSSTRSSTIMLALSNKTTSGTNSGGGGGGAGKTQSATSSSSSSDDTTTYDKMDLNKDGTVSASEKALYLMMHPDEVEEDNTIQSYTNRGNTG